MDKKSFKKDKQYSIANLTKKIPNRFLLTMAIAKRARQLKDGAQPLIDIDGNFSPMTIAMKEIEEGKILADYEDANELEDSSLDDINDYLDTENIEALEQKTSNSSKNSVS